MRRKKKKEGSIRPGKAVNQILHAIERAKQRYNIHLTYQEYDVFIDMIQKQKGTFLERRSSRTSKWLLKYKDKELICIYDNKRKTIVTFLPPPTNSSSQKNKMKNSLM